MRRAVVSRDRFVLIEDKAELQYSAEDRLEMLTKHTESPVP
jgi:Flp pilus assembly CpaF family ATPase